MMETRINIGCSFRCCLCVLLCVFILSPTAFAGQVDWTGSGDGFYWSDDDNWSSGARPTSVDDVTVDADDAAVIVNQTFSAKTLTIGGSETSTVSTNNFVSGTIAPATTSDVGVLTRSGGTLRLSGSAGTVTLKGQYKSSREMLSETPSFMMWVK